ncbi:MAG TPA: hypothetical protein VHW95_17130 [Steroidobacteraceae bacterium]|nr:hypothetical protein [Steroidobacteraceae bacterium]
MFDTGGLIRSEIDHEGVQVDLQLGKRRFGQRLQARRRKEIIDTADREMNNVEASADASVQVFSRPLQ